MLLCWRRFGSLTHIFTTDLIPIFTRSLGLTSSCGSPRMATSHTPSGWLYFWWMKIIIIYNLFSTTDIYHFHQHTFQNKYNSIFAEPSYLRLTCLNLLHYFNCTTSFISLQPQFISFWITLLKIHLDTHFQHKIWP